MVDSAEHTFQAGETVRVPGVRGEFTVVSGELRKGQVEVARGGLRIWVDSKKLEKVELPKQSRKTRRTTGKSAERSRSGSAGLAGSVGLGGAIMKGLGSGREMIKIDLHGQTVAQALEQLDKTLDVALLEGANSIEIMHGLGSGALKNAVHRYLSQSKHVKQFTISPSNPGVTIAYV